MKLQTILITDYDNVRFQNAVNDVLLEIAKDFTKHSPNIQFSTTGTTELSSPNYIEYAALITYKQWEGTNERPRTEGN